MLEIYHTGPEPLIYFVFFLMYLFMYLFIILIGSVLGLVGPVSNTG